MLRHQAVLFFCLKSVFFNIMDIEHRSASGKAGQAGQNPDGGGLARAVGAEIGKEFAALQPEIDASQRLDRFVVFDQIGNLDHAALPGAASVVSCRACLWRRSWSTSTTIS